VSRLFLRASPGGGLFSESADGLVVSVVGLETSLAGLPASAPGFVDSTADLPASPAADAADFAVIHGSETKMSTLTADRRSDLGNGLLSNILKNRLL
jgi:hypothetical protein